MKRPDQQYDVVVAGGGAAGVAAAVGAARSGARTLLVERAPFLGGAATWSSVATYCGFWSQSDPPRRAVDGVGGTVLAALERLGADTGPTRMPVSGVVVALVDPEQVKLTLDTVTADAGVDVLLHATLAGADAAGGRVQAVTLADHDGTWNVAARAFVDASGEADLAARAGAATRYGGDDGEAQSGTLVVRIGGIERDADTSRHAWERAIADAKARGTEPLTKEHGFVCRVGPSGDVFTFLADETYDALDAASIGAAERRARLQAWALLGAIRTLPGHERAYLVTTGPAIGTRESRHVIAPYRLRAADVQHLGRFEDAVALGAWPIERHPGGGARTSWQRLDDDGVYEIPLRTLCSATHANLFAAGRVIDAEPDAFASARVMGTAFSTGHAAGVAAALVAAGEAPDAGRVRARLREQDAIIDAPERTCVS